MAGVKSLIMDLMIMELPIRHLSGDVKQRTGYISLEFRDEVQAGDRNLK